jgi:hypothetical protein
MHEVKLGNRVAASMLSGQRIMSVTIDGETGDLTMGLESGSAVKISAATDDPYTHPELEIVKLINEAPEQKDVT